ncbi:uncharacterized protein LOC118946545 [Oncorhynchus mykiss]|uniref:uncharacterized protein LOC118946545 n=1 Tax=Oncorhynchus mykiss TaxID=8022 RepID=UPI001878CA83|nr:uncharacterized protein LOC118946545 [Oncorhynchus mykiss]
MANQQPSKPRVTNQTTSQATTTASVLGSSAQLGRHCARVRDEGWEDEEEEADQEADQVDGTSTCSQTPTYGTVSPYSEDPDVVIEDVEYIEDGCDIDTYDPCVTPLEVNPLGLLGTQSESAISRHEITKGERLFYGAHMGSETRNVEFKRGGGEYLRSSFRAHLRRYACAFLNSGGGSLLAGVDDDGVVRGLRCDHRQEDQARLLVDSILKGFHPTLLPHSYTLAFLPVVRPGPESQNLKVLRLTLRPPPALTQQGLYQTDQGEVFLRRDGSVEGPLSASAIQEWARQRWSGEVSRLQHCVEVLLSEQRLLLQEIRQQSQAIAALQSAQTQAPSQAQEYTQAPTQAPTQTHIHVHTHTQAQAHVKTPATESLGNRLMQILGKAGRATPLHQEVPSVTPAAPSSALPLVPFMAPDLNLLRESPGRAHLCPSLSPGHNQGPGPPHFTQCQCTECRSNICRLM